jgi:hypothetical protein
MLAMRWCGAHCVCAYFGVLQANPYTAVTNEIHTGSPALAFCFFRERLGAKLKPRPSLEGVLVSSQPHLIFTANPCGQGEERSRSVQGRRSVVCVAWAFALALASGRSMEIGRMSLHRED